MTLLGGIGCVLISLGPCVVLSIFTIARYPLKVIVLTISAFFWLISLLIASLSWLIFKHLTSTLAPSLVCGVLAQEASRLAFYKFIIMADSGLRVMISNASSFEARQNSRYLSATNMHTDAHSTSIDPCISNRGEQQLSADPEVTVKPACDETKCFDHRIVAYVAGLGFGLMTGVFELMHNMIDSFGPGIGLEFWEAKTFFVIAAFETMCISVMQIFWSVILFVSFEQRLYGVIAAAYLSHLMVSCSSLVNHLNFPWPELVCSFHLIALIGLGFCTAKISGLKFSLPRRSRLTTT